MPAEHADALTAAAAVEHLFITCGAPLVLKTDNGSPFIAGPLRELPADWQVILLLSPPCTPRCNGSVEAGMGSIKTGTFYEAVQHGRGGTWT